MRLRRVLLAALAVAVVPLAPLAVTVGTAAPVAASATPDPSSPSTALDAAALAAGSGHTCELRDGAVRCWGLNDKGQLGVGDTAARGDTPDEVADGLSPVDLGTGRTAVQLAVGGWASCALLDNGTVKCWGDDQSGQLGIGETANRGDGPGEMGDALPTVNLGTGRTARTIARGVWHQCAILDNGALKCWGDNSYGQLGLGDTTSRGGPGATMGDALPTVNLGSGRTARSLALGWGHTCAILDDGSVKCWGNSTYGQLGAGDTATRGDGANEMGGNLPTVDLGTGRTAVAITAGVTHTCVLLDDGAVKCWGSAGVGELGLGDTANRGDGANEMGDDLPTVDLGSGRAAREVRAGGSHTCAILDDGTAKCWGYNADGELGIGSSANRGDGPNEMGDQLPAVILGTGRTVRDITVGAHHVCAVLDDGAAKCWGRNADGELGIGSTANRGDGPNEMGDALPVVAMPGTDVVDVTAGGFHTCARLDGGRLKCWGSNFQGQLGLGDSDVRGDGANEMGDQLPAVDLGTGRTAVAIAAGYDHTCAILDDGSVKCWGFNFYGALGRGSSDSIGNEPGEMGDDLPTVDLGTGRTAVAIAAGKYFTCAILDDGRVKCWGYNGYGMLGQGVTTHRGDAPGEMGDNLPAIDLGTGRTARDIATGDQHVCAILDDSTVKCWGRNVFGQLGLGDSTGRGDNGSEMGDQLPAVNLGTGRTPRAITAGGGHTCAFLDDDTVKCWGYNGFGQLGQGDSASRGDDANEMGDDLPTVDLGTGRTPLEVHAKGNTTCALLLDRRVKCWGANGAGQLGQGDSASRGDNANEMGDDLPTIDLGGRIALGIIVGSQFVCATTNDSALRCWGNGGFGSLGLEDTASLGDQPGELGEALAAVRVFDPPTVTLAAPSTPDPLRSTHFVLAASESISGATADDFFTSGTATGCTHSLTASGGTGFTILVDCTSDGTVTLHLRRGRVLDTSGDTGPVQTVSSAAVTLLDPVPTASWTGSPVTPTEDHTLTYTVTMSEAVANLGSTAFVVRGTATGCVVSVPYTNGVTATVEVHCDGNGTVLLALKANSVTDSGGNTGPAADAGAPSVVIGAPQTLAPVTPARLLDTRSGVGGVPRARVTGTTGAMTPLVFRAAGRAGVPSSGVAAVSLNLTVVEPSTDGYATVYPCGTIPDTSSVNFTAGRTTANAVVTPLSATGDFCVIVFGDAHVIADITGWYATGRGFASVTPSRLYDTRSGLGGVPSARVGSTSGSFTPLVFHVAGRSGVPSSGASAVSLNLTVVEPSTDGYATVYPCGTIPDTSSVNFTAGRTTANAVVTPLSATGDFCVIVFGDAHVIADVNGWYASGSGFNALTPSRLLDTRTGLGGVAVRRIGSPTGALAPLTFRVAGRGGVPSSGATTVSVNVTIVEPSTDGYATIYPCGTIPDTSTVNFTAGRTTANAATTPLSANGDFCVIVRGDAHVIVDVNGWYS